jgi:hypothetical protein
MRTGVRTPDSEPEERPVAEKKSAWTVPGPVGDDAYKGTAAANPVLVLGAGPQAPVRNPLHGDARRQPGGEDARDGRTPAQIEADLDATRARLSDTLDELQERLSPRTLARQAGRGVKAGFVDPGSGRVRPRRAVLAAGAAAGAVAVLAVVRASRHRS